MVLLSPDNSRVASMELAEGEFKVEMLPSFLESFVNNENRFIRTAAVAPTPETPSSPSLVILTPSTNRQELTEKAEPSLESEESESSESKAEVKEMPPSAPEMTVLSAVIDVTSATFERSVRFFFCSVAETCLMFVQVLRCSRPLLMVVYTRWCAFCKAILPLLPLIAEYEPHISVVQVSVFLLLLLLLLLLLCSCSSCC
jgi:thiol-disulfide isomerase/thioredoxin